MTSAAILGTIQTLPNFSNTLPDSQNKKGAVAQIAGAAVSGNDRQPAVDTVSIAGQPRQAVTDGRKESARVEKGALPTGNDKSGGAAAKVEFMYDVKGELVIKYMDTADRIVYQMPSELMLRLKESAGKSESSVDTKA